MKKLGNFKLSAVLFALLSLLTFTSTFAKGAGDYYDLEKRNARIALSSDGNMHDNDDHFATKMTLMILAKAGLQDKTVLYTHSDHVWWSEDNDEAKMVESAETTGQKFGFNDCKFMAAVKDSAAACQAMAAEIAKSTSDNPLFIIAAGPMQVVGRGFEIANGTNPDALNYVTIISHSSWNNKHSDNNGVGNGSNTEDYHYGWTWTEMEAAFGTKVNFNYISDQNGTGTGSEVYTSKDKFAAKDVSYWSWMNEHKDPNVNWIYKGNLVGTGSDYSDAGMAYYMVADLDGERGDEFGNPVKLEEWIGTEVIPTEYDDTRVWSVSVTPATATIDEVGQTIQLSVEVGPTTATDKSVTWTSSNTAVATVDANGLVTAVSKGSATITSTTTDKGLTATSLITVGKAEAGDITVGEDFIAFEAESSKSTLGDNWVIRTSEDPLYDGIKGDMAAMGGAYIETTQGQTNGLGITAGTDMLQYVFTPKTSGTYTLTGRMAQRLDVEGESTAWDECNDIYIKMEGDYTSSVALNILQNWNKYYGRGHVSAKYGTWGSFVQLDKSDVKYKAVYNLTAGEEYTLSISARSKAVCIDYFILIKSTATFTYGEQKDIAVLNDSKYWPGTSTVFANETYKGSDFTVITDASKTNIDAADFVTAKIDYKTDANGEKTYLSIVDWCKWGAAEVEYQGEDADVNIFINTLLEEDGESTYKLYLNDVLVGETTNERIYDTSTANYTIKGTKLTESAKVAIKKGDKIRVEFNSATNGFVPEDNTTATSRGRWASVVVTTMENQSSSSTGDDSGSTGTDEAPVLVSHNAPTNVKLGTTSFQFQMVYTSTAVVDFAITIHDKTNSVTSGFAFVRENGLAAGENISKTIEVPIDKALEAGIDYQWSIYFLPSGGTWKNQYPSTLVPFTASDAETTGIIETEVAPLQIIADGNAIIVTANETQAINVYTISGQLIQSTTVVAGNTTTVASDLAKGIYVVNNQKVVIK